MAKDKINQGDEGAKATEQTELTEEGLLELLKTVEIVSVADLPPVGGLDREAAKAELDSLPEDPNEPVRVLNEIWIDLKKSADDEAKRQKKLIALAQQARDRAQEQSGPVKARITQLKARIESLDAEANKEKLESARVKKAKAEQARLEKEQAAKRGKK